MTYAVRGRRGNPVTSGLRRMLARPYARRALAVGGFAAVGWLLGAGAAHADDTPADTAVGIVQAPVAGLDAHRTDGTVGKDVTGLGIQSTERAVRAIESTGRGGLRRAHDHITSPRNSGTESTGGKFGKVARRVADEPSARDVPLLRDVPTLGHPRDLGEPLSENGLGLEPSSSADILPHLSGGDADAAVAPGGREDGRDAPGWDRCAERCAGSLMAGQGALASALARDLHGHMNEQALADLPVAPPSHPGSQNQGASGMLPSPNSGVPQQLSGVGDVARPWLAQRRLLMRAPRTGALAPVVRTAADEPSFSPD